MQTICMAEDARGQGLGSELLAEEGRRLDAVWGWNVTSSTRTVDVHVAGLRKKLERDRRAPRYILTLHGIGYKFVAAMA